MGKLYFAKTKDTQEIYVGRRHQAGFSNIGDLKRSISYDYRSNSTGKRKEDYDFYCVDTDTMTVEKYKK